MVNPKQYYTLQEIIDAGYAVDCQSRQQLGVFVPVPGISPVTKTTGIVGPVKDDSTNEPRAFMYWSILGNLMSERFRRDKCIVDFDKISWNKEQVEANKLAVICHSWEEAKFIYELLTGELMPSEAKESYEKVIVELGWGLTPIVIGYDEQGELNFDHPQREGFALMHHCWITPEQMGYRKLADILVEIVDGELTIRVKGGQA